MIQTVDLGQVIGDAAFMPAFSVGADREAEPDSNVQAELDARLLIEKLANNLTTTEAGLALDARQGKALSDAIATKFGLTQLWSGTWGASGSADITVPGIADYSHLAFYVNGNIFFTVRGSVANVFTIVLSGTTATCRLIYITRSDETLSVSSARQISITSAGAITSADLTTNPISIIYGAKR